MICPPHNREKAGEVCRSGGFARRQMEAGGVEPPSEKRYGSKPTCLAQFRLFRRPRSEWARNATG